MTTPHDKVLETFQIEEVQMVEYVDGFKQAADPMYRIVANGYCADFPSRAAAENFRREFSSAVISAYLSSIGGIVCGREPVGAWYEDSTGCFHMSLNVEIEEKKARENGHQIHYFHEPIEAGNGGDGWLPIDRADRTITDVQNFSEVGITLRMSDRYWVRDEDGRVYEAAWSEDNGRDFWWDFEGESPVDPVEFMPHPLDRRFSSTPSNEGREKA